MWKRAVWLEGKKEEEGVVPSSWVLEENQTLFWPQGVNAENALHNQQEPDPASWRKFMLKKVKITSDSFQECDTYHLTSTVESSESNSDPDEGLLMRKRRKRCKKNLPDDFVSSENLHEAVHMKPASQKPQVTTSQDKVASDPCNDPCNDNQKNHKGSQEDAESSFLLTKFQKRVLQLLLDIRKTVSDTSTCGGKPADTACTLTIKRNNSLEEVQNLEDELVNPSYFM
ncbi:uncharacterized protein LOC135101958 [Scylla paramamosain]